MKLLVLAGGFGTRLQSVLAGVPKALAPVGKVPFLYLQIQHWKSQGITSFAFLLHHQADQIINFLQQEQYALLRDIEVYWLVEPKPMDTGGALAYAVEQLRLKDDFLVTNADTWLGKGIAEVTQAKSPVMAVVELRNAARYGCVQVNRRQLVTSFQEKNDSQGVGWINAGLCKFNAALFKGWDHSPFSLERVTFPTMVARRELRAVALQTEFIDIGIPDEYYRFCRWIAADRKGVLCS